MKIEIDAYRSIELANNGGGGISFIVVQDESTRTEVKKRAIVLNMDRVQMLTLATALKESAPPRRK